MSALIIFVVLGIWSALLYNAGYHAGFAIERKWVRQAAGAATVVAVTTLVLWDEVAGTQEFEKLCTTARKFEISQVDEGKKFEVRFSRSDKRMLLGFWRPIEEHTDFYTDVKTGRVIATGKGYSAKGGVLVRTLGINPLNGGKEALFGNTFCSPVKYEDQVRRLRAMINIDV